MRTHRARATVSQQLLPAGIHVAPYLSSEGRLVLLAVARGGYLVAAREIARFADTPFEGRKGLAGVRVGQRGFDRASFVLEPCASQDGFLPFVWHGNGGLRGRSLAATLWSRGVYLAPWRDFIRDLPESEGVQIIIARPWIAVDHRHRIVAEMAVPEGADATQVRQDLLAILEIAEAAETPAASKPEPPLESYTDGYGDDEDDSAEDFGNEWKRGAR